MIIATGVIELVVPPDPGMVNVLKVVDSPLCFLLQHPIDKVDEVDDIT